MCLTLSGLPLAVDGSIDMGGATVIYSGPCSLSPPSGLDAGEPLSRTTAWKRLVAGPGRTVSLGDWDHFQDPARQL